MTRPTDKTIANHSRRNLDLVEWLAGGALRPDATAKPVARDDGAERAFRKLHADARFRSRLWL